MTMTKKQLKNLKALENLRLKPLKKLLDDERRAREGDTVEVTENAIMKRAKRKLAPEGKRLEKARNPGFDEPRYYVIEGPGRGGHWRSRGPCGPEGNDLAAIARELGVLRPHEVLHAS